MNLIDLVKIFDLSRGVSEKVRNFCNEIYFNDFLKHFILKRAGFTSVQESIEFINENFTQICK